MIIIINNKKYSTEISSECYLDKIEAVQEDSSTPNHLHSTEKKFQASEEFTKNLIFEQMWPTF